MVAEGHVWVLGLRSPQARRGGLRLVGSRGSRESRIKEVPGATLEAISTTEMTVLAGRAVGESFRNRHDHPEAVFAANDLLAIGVLQALTMQANLRVPDDIARGRGRRKSWERFTTGFGA